MLDTNNIMMQTGNLVRDAEIKTTKNGAEILEFTLAINGAGNTLSDPAFLMVKMWLVENDYSTPAVVRPILASAKNGELTKGLRVSVVGSFKMDTWKNDKGEPASRPVLLAENIKYFVNSERRGSSSDSAPTQTAEVSSEGASASDDVGSMRF